MSKEFFGYVGGVDKEIPSDVWEKFHREHEARIGLRLLDWDYIPDPDPEVFRHGEARFSYKLERVDGKPLTEREYYKLHKESVKL